MSSWMHPKVQDLVHAVGRAFYTDSEVVVLDALTTNVFLRADRLDGVFSFPPKMAKAILSSLVAEKLVCRVGLSERRKRDDGAGDGAGAGAGAGPAAPGADGKDGGADGDEGPTGKARESTPVYFINPRYFVDAVYYRRWLIQFTDVEALVIARQYQLEAGVFVCSHCRCELSSMNVVKEASATGTLETLLEQQLAETGIDKILRELRDVELDGNHPKDHIEKGTATLHRTADATDAEASVGTFLAGPRQTFKVEISRREQGGTTTAPPATDGDAAVLRLLQAEAEAADAATKAAADNAAAAAPTPPPAAAGQSKPPPPPPPPVAATTAAAAAAPPAPPATGVPSVPAPAPPAPAPAVAPTAVPAQQRHHHPPAPVPAAAPGPAPAAAEAHDDAVDDAENPLVSVNGVMKRYYDVTDEDTELMTADEYNAFASLGAGDDYE